MQGVLPLFRSCISDMYIVHLHGVDESARTLDCSQFSRHWQKHVKTNEKKSWFQHARECLSLRAPLLICKFSTSMMWMNLQGLANLHSWAVTDKHMWKATKKYWSQHAVEFCLGLRASLFQCVNYPSPWCVDEPTRTPRCLQCSKHCHSHWL